MAAGFYLAFDIDRIQQTVFESNVLPVVRGGSMSLRKLAGTEGIEEAFGGAVDGSIEVVFADGGSGLLKILPTAGLSEASAEERLRHHIATKSGFASVTTATLSFDTPLLPGAAMLTPKSAALPTFDAIPSRSFARAFRVLSQRLDDQKRDKGFVSHWGLPAWATVCESCGWRPVAVTDVGRQRRQLCCACDARYRWHLDALKAAKEDDGGKLDQYQSMDEFYDTVALVYLDGNAIGVSREAACERGGNREEGESGLKDFASAFRKMIDAGLKAIESKIAAPAQGHTGSGDGPPALKANRAVVALSLGGDDVAIMTRGCRALDALRAFYDAVTKESRVVGLERLTFSAGIVVAPFRTPIPFLHRYAEDLCASAKRLWRRLKEEGKVAWTCDLIILTGSSPLATDLAALRRDELTVQRAAERLALWSGPWTFRELSLLSVLQAGERTTLVAGARRVPRREGIEIYRCSRCRPPPEGGVPHRQRR